MITTESMMVTTNTIDCVGVDDGVGKPIFACSM
jgi:hypothetical protein